jgi:hypothetical protein
MVGCQGLFYKSGVENGLRGSENRGLWGYEYKNTTYSVYCKGSAYCFPLDDGGPPKAAMKDPVVPSPGLSALLLSALCLDNATSPERFKASS